MVILNYTKCLLICIYIIIILYSETNSANHTFSRCADAIIGSLLRPVVPNNDVNILHLPPSTLRLNGGAATPSILPVDTTSKHHLHRYLEVGARDLRRSCDLKIQR